MFILKASHLTACLYNDLFIDISLCKCTFSSYNNRYVRHIDRVCANIMSRHRTEQYLAGDYVMWLFSEVSKSQSCTKLFILDSYHKARPKPVWAACSAQLSNTPHTLFAFLKNTCCSMYRRKMAPWLPPVCSMVHVSCSSKPARTLLLACVELLTHLCNLAVILLP